MRKLMIAFLLTSILIISCETSPYTYRDYNTGEKPLPNSSALITSIVPGLTQAINGEYLDATIFLSQVGFWSMAAINYKDIYRETLTEYNLYNAKDERGYLIIYASLAAGFQLWNYLDGIKSTKNRNYEYLKIVNEVKMKRENEEELRKMEEEIKKIEVDLKLQKEKEQSDHLEKIKVFAQPYLEHDKLKSELETIEAFRMDIVSNEIFRRKPWETNSEYKIRILDSLYSDEKLRGLINKYIDQSIKLYNEKYVIGNENNGIKFTRFDKDTKEWAFSVDNAANMFPNKFEVYLPLDKDGAIQENYTRIMDKINRTDYKYELVIQLKIAHSFIYNVINCLDYWEIDLDSVIGKNYFELFEPVIEYSKDDVWDNMHKFWFDIIIDSIILDLPNDDYYLIESGVSLFTYPSTTRYLQDTNRSVITTNRYLNAKTIKSER